MPFIRFVPIAFALALCGCGSFGAISLSGSHEATPPVETSALPPPTGTPPPADPAAMPPAAPPGTAPATDATPPPVAPTAPAPGALGRTDLLGGWTITSGGDSCQLFMTLTSWTGGYRASTRGCNNGVLKSISAWNLDGKDVILAGAGGAPVARLSSTGNGRFAGTAAGAATPVSFYR